MTRARVHARSRSCSMRHGEHVVSLCLAGSFENASARTFLTLPAWLLPKAGGVAAGSDVSCIPASLQPSSHPCMPQTLQEWRLSADTSSHWDISAWGAQPLSRQAAHLQWPSDLQPCGVFRPQHGWLPTPLCLYLCLRAICQSKANPMALPLTSNCQPTCPRLYLQP